MAATARELFDRNQHLEFGCVLTVHTEPEPIAVPVRVVYDFLGGSKYIRAYVPITENPDQVIWSLANQLEVVWQQAASVLVQFGFHECNETINAAELRFSGRLWIWTPCIINNFRWEFVKSRLREIGIDLLVRDGEFVNMWNRDEKPRAFICHDSRDKETFVRELASKLSSMLCPVWYDEYSLVPGQSLRESIERGLKECSKCVVILSENFFSNPGWTKREFDSIYTREILQGKKLMLPIWLGVSKEAVYEYSPVLLDIVGINAELGLDEVVRRVFNAIRSDSLYSEGNRLTVPP